MMKMMIGFFESYLDGSAPSMIPPCWAALETAEVVTGFAVTVLVTMEVITLAII